SDTDTNDHRVTPMLIVKVADETTIADGYVRRLGIIGRNAVQVSSPVCVALIRYGSIEIPIRKCYERDIFNRVCMFEDCLCVLFRQRFACTLFAILIWIKSGRKMKSVDIIGAVFFDELDQVLTQAGENGRDCDNRRYTDDNTEHRQRASEL